jgi:hypothetical protein
MNSFDIHLDPGHLLQLQQWGNGFVSVNNQKKLDIQITKIFVTIDHLEII